MVRRNADDWRRIVVEHPGKCGSEIARAIGVTPSAACIANKRHGLGITDKRPERMRKLHADPEFARAHAERSSERMRKRNADGTIQEAKKAAAIARLPDEALPLFVEYLNDGRTIQEAEEDARLMCRWAPE